MGGLAGIRNEIQKPGVGRANGGNMELVGADAPFEALRAEGFGATHRLDFVICAQPDRANRGAVHEEIGMREGIPFGVHDEIDLALLEKHHVLAAVLPGTGKSELDKQAPRARSWNRRQP